MVQYVLPNDANPLGALLGGRLMHWIDLAGALAAHRHSRSYVVTASIDHLDFLVPGRVGDLVVLQSSVNRVFHTSLEVGVKVWVEHYLSNERSHVSSAYLTFVAVDRHGRKLQVPPVLPETEDEKRRYEDAGNGAKSGRRKRCANWSGSRPLTNSERGTDQTESGLRRNSWESCGASSMSSRMPTVMSVAQVTPVTDKA